MLRALVTAALGAVAAASLVGIGYSLDELTGGVRDVHEHWWSTAPVVTLGMSVAAWMLLRATRPA